MCKASITANFDPWERSTRLLGRTAVAQLARARVVVFGVGGVGSFAVEALVRSGVGYLALVDADTVAASDLNRQLHATHATLGRAKVQVMRERALAINPRIEVEAHEIFYLPANAAAIDIAAYDYIIDAVDTVTAKVEIAVRATAAGTPLISCMGAGNKLDPTQFTVGDIFATTVCPLCRAMRRQLRGRGVTSLQVVWSRETPRAGSHDSQTRQVTPGSVAFVPSVAGLIAAGVVVRHLCGIRAGDPGTTNGEET